jgi:hypothetical protein
MTEHQHDPDGRAEPPGQQPEYDRPPYGQPQYGQSSYGQSPYGQSYDQPQYGQPQYGQPQYGQPPYVQSTYGQPQYGQPPYAPSPYGEQQTQPYGQPGGPQQYGQYSTGRPAKPGGVVTAAVLGFVFGAIGALVTLFFVFVGAVASGARGDIESELPGFGEAFGAFGGALLVVGLLALLWTVLMLWGSVWALTGRSRVLLLVGSSIALAFTAISVIGNLANADRVGAGSIVVSLLFFLAALAVVVLLSVRAAAQFFAAHRALRRR